jgi:tryptophanyl-tRNA synthetase
MRVVSGIQPTGNLHLGNYLGAIRRWVRLQREAECLIFLADLHAITVYNDPAELRANVNGMAAALIACGIDPDEVVLFNHARVPAHPEMAWILGCTARIGWLNRMTQFKEKSGRTAKARASACSPIRCCRRQTCCSTRRPTSRSARTRSSISS